MIVGTNIDYSNRFEEAASFNRIFRAGLPEIHAIFPNVPVFLSELEQTYPYEVALSATGTGADAGKAKWDSPWGTRESFDDVLAAVAATGQKLNLHPQFNGYGGNWATQTYFNWSSTFPSGSSATPSTWYGYKHPDPADADANADAVCAMLARAHYHHGIEWHDIELEYDNEWEYINFGGSASSGTGVDAWTNGSGYVSYPRKVVWNTVINTVRTRFPRATCPFKIQMPSFASPFHASGTPVRNENFQIGGVTLSAITNGHIDSLNGHCYQRAFETSGLINNYDERLFIRLLEAWCEDGFIAPSRELAYLDGLDWVWTEWGNDSGTYHAIGGPCDQEWRAWVLLVMARYFARKRSRLIIHYMYHNRLTGYDALSSTSNHGLIPWATANGGLNIGIDDPEGKYLAFWAMAQAFGGVETPSNVSYPVEAE